MNNTPEAYGIIPTTIYSGFYGQTLTLPAYFSPRGELLLSHSGLKQFILQEMKLRVCSGKNPIHYFYETVYAADVTYIVNCTFCMGDYRVTESGESNSRTLYTSVAKDYPYIVAQKRSFDRAAISFLQLLLDGKRVYSDSEIPAFVSD